jgi:hypothetical protein
MTVRNRAAIRVYLKRVAAVRRVSQSSRTVAVEPRRAWKTPPVTIDARVDPGEERSEWLCDRGFPAAAQLRIRQSDPESSNAIHSIDRPGFNDHGTSWYRGVLLLRIVVYRCLVRGRATDVYKLWAKLAMDSMELLKKINGGRLRTRR